MSLYKGAPRLDATNVAGLTSLMNKQHIKHDINLQQIENSIMNKDCDKSAVTPTDVIDPVDFYTIEINKLAEELGVEVITNDTKPIPISNEEPVSNYDTIVIDDRVDDVISASSSASTVCSKNSKSSRHSKNSRHSRVSKISRHSRRSNDNDYSTFIETLDNSHGIKLNDELYKNRYSMNKVRVNNGENTDETDTKILKSIRSDGVTPQVVENEKLKDVKTSKIEQISQLRMNLEEEGINCDNLTHPDTNTTMSEIDSVLNVLRLKNDRNRYSTLAEEVILGFAEGIETVFDGSREIPFFKWKPDYRGYHSTVNIKLHRMRFETGQVVGSIIEAFNIGPKTRIIMELLPSFFLYPRQNSKQKSSPGLHSDLKVDDATLSYAAIKTYEENNEILNKI